jgi:hypothetical protein
MGSAGTYRGFAVRCWLDERAPGEVTGRLVFHPDVTPTMLQAWFNAAATPQAPYEEVTLADGRRLQFRFASFEGAHNRVDIIDGRWRDGLS